MAAAALKSAIPSHLKPSGDEEGARKHHGKSQSHVVSDLVTRRLLAPSRCHFMGLFCAQANELVYSICPATFARRRCRKWRLNSFRAGQPAVSGSQELSGSDSELWQLAYFGKQKS